MKQATDVWVRYPTPADIKHIAQNLRDQDKAEALALGVTDFEQGLRQSVERSALCAVAVSEHGPVMVFGVAPSGMLSGRAQPWAMGTDQVLHHRRALTQLSPPYIQEMLRRFPHLWNIVHARNLVSIRWLKRMGFNFPGATVDVQGEVFHLFEMRA